MPTKVDKKIQAILDRGNQQLSGAASGTPVDPATQAILDRGHQEVANMQPPAPVTTLPAPETPPVYPTGPVAKRYPLGPHGRVIDPTTGAEFDQPGQGAHENAPQTMDTLPLEKGLKVVQEYAFKPLTFYVDPITAVLNTISEGAMKGERDPTLGPVLGSLKGAATAAITKGPRAAQQGLLGPPVTPRFLNPPGYDAPGRPGGVDLPISPGVNRGGREVGNFLLSMFGSDAAAAKMFGGVVALAAPEVRASLQSTGLLDKPIPGVGKSVNALQGEARLRNVVKQAMVKGDAIAGQIRREGDQVMQRVEGIYNGYRKRGVDFAEVLPDGRRVNKADQLVTHWIEAGRPGATYSSRAAVEAEAVKIGLDPADLRTIAADVSRVYKKTGQWLESVGFLKKGTVAHYGDQYAARLYHYASHNPADIEAAIEAGRATGTISPEAEYLAMKVGKQGRGGGYSAAKGRKVVDPVVGEMLGREHQAGVVLGAALPRQAARGARFQALQDISRNPELFSVAQQPGWVQRKYGPVEGWFHPVADKVLQQVAHPRPETLAEKALTRYSGLVRRGWVALNPAVQLGNIKQNIALAEGFAAAHGVHWNPGDAIADLPGFIKAAKGKVADPFYESLAARSRAFSGESGALGEAGRSLRGSIGIDTAAQRLAKGAKKVANAPAELFGKTEELFKYSLFKKLVKGGMSEDEAAQVTQRALFDHTDVDARVAALNKYGIMPFLPTRLKGLENSLSIWLKNPDILLRHSGFRLGQSALEIAGPEAQVRNRIDNPSGRLRVPIPGARDRYGRQQFASGQLLSQTPFMALDPQMNNPFSGGVFAPLINAATNYDPFKAQMTGGDGQIVRPGSMPPLDALKARAGYAVTGTVPALTPFLGRGANRIGRAASGTTEYPGASQEPQTLTQALLQTLTGVRVSTPETPDEKGRRMITTTDERAANQRFLDEYQAAVDRGDVTPEDFSAWDSSIPKDPRKLADYFKTAFLSLQSEVTGAREKPGSMAAKAKIRRLSDWMHYLEMKFDAVGVDRDQLARDLSEAMAGGG